MQVVTISLYASLYLLQPVQSWIPGTPKLNGGTDVKRRDVLASAGLSVLTIFAPPSFAEEATTMLPEVEAVAAGESRKVI
jgi:hypothetical protein